MLIPNGHVDYRVRLNGDALIGVAKVKVPGINRKTVTVEGAGTGGEIEVPLGGMIKAMRAEFDFSSVTDAIIALGDNQWHDVALYDAFQYFDTESGTEELEQDRIEMTIRAIDEEFGTVGVASAADASGTYSCRKLAIYKDGKLVKKIDQLNNIHVNNGVDCAEPLRKALGMM